MAPIRGQAMADGSQDGFLTENHFSVPIIIRSDPLTDDYDVESRPFARGKYAQVRRCKHKTTGISYAAKVIRKTRRSQDVRHEIMHEIRVLLMASENEKIVKLHEVFETATEYILMLEMVEGGELQRVLDEEDAIPERDVILLMRQILEAIAFLHINNIAHLDIKPQNILLVKHYPSVEIKLCDFGISRFIAKGSELREIVGTPDYVAPEILHYDPISLATDMWSVGILAYVLLTGYSPFGGDTKQETFSNITNNKLEFPSELFENISSQAIDFITKLLIKNPLQRMTYQECFDHEWLKSQLVDNTTSPLVLSNASQEEYDSDKENNRSSGEILLKNQSESGLSSEIKNILDSVSNREQEVSSNDKSSNSPARGNSRSRSLSPEKHPGFKMPYISPASAVVHTKSVSIRVSNSSVGFESITRKARTIFKEDASEERITIVY